MLQLKRLPNFSFEKRLWKRGFKFVVGVDEVGRGAWAGPIVVGAVIWPRPLNLKSRATGRASGDARQISNLKSVEEIGINDSKMLKPRFREQLAEEIKARALTWDVSEVGVGVINKISIGKATQKAMRKTTSDLTKKGFKPDFVLVDYFYIPYLRGFGRKTQLGIKDGDQKSISIASASILAKVHRDKIMRCLSRKYPVYGWGQNKGYGTKLHQKAILRYGLTRFHRKEFVKTWMAKPK